MFYLISFLINLLQLLTFPYHTTVQIPDSNTILKE
jgi:hypothetical protein